MGIVIGITELFIFFILYCLVYGNERNKVNETYKDKLQEVLDQARVVFSHHANET
jgi:hypothetical protein